MTISINARNLLTLDNIPSGSNHVCDPTRFSLLGLNMADFPYCDKSLPFDVRAKDLVDRMTLDEKAKQVGNKAEGVLRLGLPKYQWWSEALHGVSNVGYGSFFDDVVPSATSFPTVILTTASFNSTLWKTIGQVYNLNNFFYYFNIDTNFIFQKHVSFLS